MIVITGLLAFQPDHLEALRPNIETLIAASRRDPGCLLYAWAEDLLEPGVIRMIEHWERWDDFEAHDASPHAATWKAAITPYGLLRREMTAAEAPSLRTL